MTVITLISVALAACIPIPIPLPQHEPDEFDRAEWLIDIGKSTKAEVIEILGEPQWEDLRDGSLYYSGEVAGALGGCVLMAGDSRAGEIIGLPWCYFRPDQDWWIKVVFDENEVVTSVETKMEKEAEAAIREFKEAELVERMKVICVGSQEGDATEQLEMYEALEHRLTYPVEAISCLCRAANRSYAPAQWAMGYAHATVWEHRAISEFNRRTWLSRANVSSDDRVAYMWFSLAVANGDPDSRYHLSHTAMRMTEDQIAQGEQMVRNWNPGDCPSAEHRLGPPGET